MNIWREQFASGALAVRAARQVVREHLTARCPTELLATSSCSSPSWPPTASATAAAGAKSQLAMEADLWDDRVQPAHVR